MVICSSSMVDFIMILILLGMEKLLGKFYTRERCDYDKDINL